LLLELADAFAREFAAEIVELPPPVVLGSFAACAAGLAE
jgi:hypothetical protein